MGRQPENLIRNLWCSYLRIFLGNSPPQSIKDISNFVIILIFGNNIWYIPIFSSFNPGGWRRRMAHINCEKSYRHPNPLGRQLPSTTPDKETISSGNNLSPTFLSLQLVYLTQVGKNTLVCMHNEIGKTI
jgi:hypothetical protein